MIGYVTIGTSDMDRSVAFYDALLGEVGAKQAFGMDRIKFWSTGPGSPMLAVCIPYDEETHHCGNGNSPLRRLWRMQGAYRNQCLRW